jgi:hypothetical protein
MLFGYSDTINPAPYNGSGQAYSNMRVHFIPIAGYPELPYNPFPANNAGGIDPNVTLTWNFGADTETYDLYFGTQNPPNQILINNQPAGTTGSYQTTTLNMGSTYFWRIIARNSNRFETPGPIWNFTTVYPPVDEDFETGTFSSHEWYFQGNADWVIDSSNAYSGNYSAKSGTITHSQQTSLLLDMEVTETSNLIFYYKVSSEATYDKLQFFVNNVEAGVWSGTIAWTEYIYTVSQGMNTFKWTYSKDGSISTGEDCAWIDYIILPATTVYDNDLAARSLTGPATINAGNTVIYNLEVKNTGLLPQSSYQIRLYKNNNQIYEQTIHTAIEPEQSILHQLIWTSTAEDSNQLVNLHATVVLANDENPNNNTSSTIQTYVYPPGILPITVGNGTILEERIPLCFYFKNSLTQTVYTASELNTYGMITNIQYYNNFTSALYNKPTKIWMGETAQLNLESGWIPATQLTLVFDGNVDYPSGANNINIEFSTPFLYENNNLVVMVQRPWDNTNYSQNDKFYITENTSLTHKTRYNRDNTETYDPYNPPETSYTFAKFPNTTFYFMIGGLGSLQGYVKNENTEPLVQAEIRCESTQQVTYSNQEGFYLFSNLPLGVHNFTASKFGYENLTQSVEIEEEIVSELDFQLSPLGVGNVYGLVVGSDFPTIGLANATVTLSGMQTYNSTTDASGDFFVSEVFLNQTYSITISHAQYTVYQSNITITGSDLGVFVLTEITTPPGNVIASQNEAQNQLQLHWNSPGQGSVEFRYDDNVPVFQIGYGNLPNAVFGAVHRNIAMIHEISWYLTSAYGSHPQVRLFLFGLNESGSPDHSQLLYQSSLIPNTDNQWNTYELPAPVQCINGFLVGVNTPNVYTSIALDDGVGEPWIFQFGTHFAINDWTNNSINWVDIGSETIFRKNMLLRATGINLGSSGRERGSEVKNERAFESYKIYRFLSYQQDNPAFWQLIASSVTDTTFTDINWGAVAQGEYKFAISAVHTNNIESVPAFSNTILKTNTNADENILPVSTFLGKNYPNPFNPETTITFSLATEQKVAIEIFNVKGEKVDVIINHQMAKGRHEVQWLGKDIKGNKAASGIYFYRMKTGDYERIEKMILLK